MRSNFDLFRRRGFEALLVAAALGFAALTSPLAAESGETVPLEDVPLAQPVSPDSLLAPEPAAPAGDAEVPPVAPQLREKFVRAQQALNAAATRLEAANAAYGNMMARNYPSGEAKAVIVTERDEARAAYDEAAGRYRELGGELPAAQADRWE